MRKLMIAVVAVVVSGCSGLMMAGGGSGSTSAERDRPAASPTSNDAALAASVRASYAADPLLSRFDIGVRAASGRVTLSGTVATYAARESAEKIAMTTAGVKAVSNEIKVD